MKDGKAEFKIKENNKNLRHRSSSPQEGTREDAGDEGKSQQLQVWKFHRLFTQISRHSEKQFQQNMCLLALVFIVPYSGQIDNLALVYPIGARQTAAQTPTNIRVTI